MRAEIGVPACSARTAVRPALFDWAITTKVLPMACRADRLGPST